MIKRPKMIMFDYGNTLFYESKFNAIRGTEAVLKYATRNEDQLSAAEISAFSNELFEQLGTARNNGIEVHHHMMLKFQYEYLGIDFSLPLDEIEQILFDNAAPGGIMPNADVMIDYLNSCGIRTSVISNIGYSGKTLEGRINQLLPRNKFEFVIASSEYIFRKPNPLIFKLALQKANLQPDDVWYCGDLIYNDVVGANFAEIYPVWYRYKDKFNEKSADAAVPECNHLQIYDWLELVNILEKSV